MFVNPYLDGLRLRLVLCIALLVRRDNSHVSYILTAVHSVRSPERQVQRPSRRLWSPSHGRSMPRFSMVSRTCSASERLVWMASTPFGHESASLTRFAESGKELLAKSAHVPSHLPSQGSSQRPSDSTDEHTLVSALASHSELCPACEQPVPFDNVSRGTCRSGHVWGACASFGAITALITSSPPDRCSITLLIISALVVRTCTCCGRKALPAPPSSADTQAGQSTTDHLLTSARVCLHCGGRWMYSH